MQFLKELLFNDKVTHFFIFFQLYPHNVEKANPYSIDNWN